MSFIINPYILGGTSPATSLSFITSTTSTASTITLPPTISPGDLLIIWSRATNSSGIPSTVIPSGFTNISTLDDGTLRKTVMCYKIADGTEDASSVSVLSGTSGQGSLCGQWRGNNPITTVSVQSLAQEATTGNPLPQTCTSGSGTPPLLVIGGYFQSLVATAISMSPTEDGSFNNGAPLQINYKIYNSSPADVTIDEGDGGTNHLVSFYMPVS